MGVFALPSHEYVAFHAVDDAALINSNASTTLRFLDHPDSGRRLAALVAASRTDVGDQMMCGAIRRLMISDPDPEVRLAAIDAYGTIFEGTSDADCLRHLAAIVLDEAQSRRDRFAAYISLFVVSARAGDEFPLRCADPGKLARLREGIEDTEWPAPMNWEFVRRCSRQVSIED